MDWQRGVGLSTAQLTPKHVTFYGSVLILVFLAASGVFCAFLETRPASPFVFIAGEEGFIAASVRRRRACVLCENQFASPNQFLAKARRESKGAKIEIGHEPL